MSNRDFPEPGMPRLLCWLCLLVAGGFAGHIGAAWALLVYFSLSALIFALFEIVRAIDSTGGRDA